MGFFCRNTNFLKLPNKDLINFSANNISVSLNTYKRLEVESN